MKFLLITPDNFTIGTFNLNEVNRQWTFNYSSQFQSSKFHPLEEFPDTSLTYGHETCHRWLASRIDSTTNVNKGFSMAGKIIEEFNKKGHLLELHPIV